MRTEFVVMGTPLSQGASPKSKNVWKAHVAAAATAGAECGYLCPLRVTVAYFCPTLGVDIDNILKPILDAMKGILYQDDRQVVHVESIAIEFTDAARIRDTTPAIAQGVAAGTDFVLVRLSPAKPIEELL